MANMTKHEHFMREALREAGKAFEADEVPVGAVVVCGDRIIGRAHNQIKLLRDPTAHAEMLAITQAADYLRNERLNNCNIYVTIEPCIMCMGASVLARVKNLIYGATDPKSGACGSVFDIKNNGRLNHSVAVKGGVLALECASFMEEFFKAKRAEKKEAL